MNLMWLNLLLVLAASWGTSESVLCEVGEALKDANNPDVDRVCGTGCPNNYYCVQSSSVQAGGICCRTRAHACSLSVAAGAFCATSSVQSQKWYFDPAKSSCCPFFYNGCFGNLNNFASSQECVAKCSGVTINNNNQQLCPAGSNVQQGANINTPCNISPFMQCQTQNGYTCTYSNTLQRSYCCSGTQPSIQFCPAGYTAATGTTVTSTCPSLTACTPGYVCMQSPANGQFYCCTQSTTPTTQLCPTGSTPANGVVASSPCQPSFGCSTPGYTCQLSPFNGFNYCCSNQATVTNVVCPQGGAPVMFAGTNQVVTCGNGAPCTSPYVCQNTFINGVNTGICCTSSNNPTIPLSTDCPSGFVPIRNSNTNRIISCAGQPCPYGACLWSPTLRVNICCLRQTRGRKLVNSSNATELMTTTEAGMTVTKE